MGISALAFHNSPGSFGTEFLFDVKHYMKHKFLIKLVVTRLLFSTQPVKHHHLRAVTQGAAIASAAFKGTKCYSEAISECEVAV